MAEQVLGTENTRGALIAAAMPLFGSQGFEATSTRAIAAAARANIGSIAYHFGGKEGLRQACAESIVASLSKLAKPMLARSLVEEALPPAAARQALAGALDRLVPFMVGSAEAGAFVQFILRELSRPSAALDILYGGIFEPVHRRLCVLFGAAVGADPESGRVKLAVFTLIGQVVYFRIGREAVLRRMGWDAVRPAETEAILAVAQHNLRAILDAWEKGA